MRLIFILTLIVLSYSCINGEWFRETQQCICNQCYTGQNCTILTPNCLIEMNHQQCTLCREWWRKLEERVIIDMDFQLKYQEYPKQDGLGPLLIETIKKGKFNNLTKFTS